MPTLWIVHRDAGRRAVLARLSGAGEDTILGDPVDRLFAGSPPADVVILGLSGDFEEELEFAHRYAPRLGHARWLLIAEPGDQDDARRLFDSLDEEIIAFPPSPESLRHRVRDALLRRSVEPLSERRSRDAIATRFARWFAGLELPELLRALDPHLARIPVLLRGEHGTGRTLLALYLHAFGGSTGGALVQIACNATLGVDALLGAIAPAARTERARRSLTVVLEDVGCLAPAVQQVLRGWIELAAPPSIAHSAWVRWIGTVSEGPEEPAPALDAGLRQALAAIPITLPPLRESPERVVALVEDVVLDFCTLTGSRPRRFSPEALETLRQYPWPGNLRELEAVVTRTAAATSGDVIHAASLRFDAESPPAPPAASHAAAEPARTELRPAPDSPAPARPETSAVAPASGSPELETWDLMGGPRAPDSPPPTPPPPATRAFASRASPSELVGDATLRRFLAALSRELGSPAADGAAAALPAERFADTELHARFGEIVQTDTPGMEEVLARLARFVAFGPPARGELDLSALLDDLIESQRADLEARQILLLRELERTQPRVLGDALQLRFALDTLLRKALQLVKARGDLYLASRFHPHGLRGAPSIRALLRFQSTARIAPGGSADGMPLSESALDLLLTEAVVRAHGGRFTLDASEGAETVILIDLPAPPTDLA